MKIRRMAVLPLLGLALLLPGCDRVPASDPGPLASVAHDRVPENRPATRAVREGQAIFRHDDFGNWRFWTDTLRLHDLVSQVTPVTALALGLKVDADAVPPDVLNAVLADPALLEDPATTRALLGLDAVVGLRAQVDEARVTRIGITCALCHSTVDNRVAPGIGSRRDGWANGDLAVGTIISLTPGLPDALRPAYASWPAGFFDPRFDLDGISDPVVIPPAYGLAGVGLETYTGEGPLSYWNRFVAVMEMHGRGSFQDRRLDIDVRVPPREDQVASKLPALRAYQRSLVAPPPPAGFYDPASAARGRLVFETSGDCVRCHVGPARSDQGRLHDPAEVGMDPTYANRGTTGAYRTTPLRGLWQHPPYFHDGSAPTLDAVVEHYDGLFSLGLTESQKRDLVEYLKSL